MSGTDLSRFVVIKEILSVSGTLEDIVGVCFIDVIEVKDF